MGWDFAHLKKMTDLQREQPPFVTAALISWWEGLAIQEKKQRIRRIIGMVNCTQMTRPASLAWIKTGCFVKWGIRKSLSRIAVDRRKFLWQSLRDDAAKVCSASLTDGSLHHSSGCGIFRFSFPLKGAGSGPGGVLRLCKGFCAAFKP